MAGLDYTVVAKFLKDYYSPNRMEMLTLKSALYADIAKNSGLVGNDFIHPVQSALSSGVSADDTIAYTVSPTPAFARWIVSKKDKFKRAVITGDSISRTRMATGAWKSAVKEAVDDAFAVFSESLAADLWGTGTGVIGQVLSVSGTVVTLTNVTDVKKFRPGQQIQASAANGGGSVRDSGNFATLTKTSYQNGTLTASVAWGTAISGLVAGDYLVERGNYDATFAGLPAWCPTVDARAANILATTFNNVDRSVDDVRLAGFAVDGNGAPKIDTISELGLQMTDYDQAPTHLYLNTIDYSDLMANVASRQLYQSDGTFKPRAEINFKAVDVAFPFGLCKVVPEKWVPKGNAWMCNPKDLEFHSMDAYPLKEMPDGLTLARISGADSFEYRILGRALLYAGKAPWRLGTCKF